MAERVFARISSEAASRWPGVALAIHHRVGRLEIGDVSLTFAAEDADDLPGEQTVMMKTVVPDQPFPEAAGARR